MNQDRLGTALMLIAAGYLGWLIADLPSVDVEVPWRNDLIIAAIGVLALAAFPRRLELSGTVLAFAVLGICINLAIFQYDALGWQGIASTVLVAIAIWCRRARLDLSDVVGVAALVAFGIAVFQPAIIAFAFIFIAVANVLLWLANRIFATRPSR